MKRICGQSRLILPMWKTVCFICRVLRRLRLRAVFWCYTTVWLCNGWNWITPSNIRKMIIRSSISFMTVRCSRFILWGNMRARWWTMSKWRCNLRKIIFRWIIWVLSVSIFLRSKRIFWSRKWRHGNFKLYLGSCRPRSWRLFMTVKARILWWWQGRGVVKRGCWCINWHRYCWWKMWSMSNYWCWRFRGQPRMSLKRAWCN